MDGLNYLKGEWEMFKKFEEDAHGEINQRLLRIEQKLDGINEDRWRLKGVIGFIGAFSGAIGALVVKHIWG